MIGGIVFDGNLITNKQIGLVMIGQNFRENSDFIFR